MSELHQRIADYLTTRRTLGYKLERHERLLGQFADYLTEIGASHITVEAAVAFATSPEQASAPWAAERMSIVRGFASWLVAYDPATEIPPQDVIPSQRPHRAVPYLYSDDDILALMAATATIRSGFRAATYRTLIGLLTVTGLRIGEAIGLDSSDVDLTKGLVMIRNAKFGKSRQLPLHATTVAALKDYRRLRDRSVIARTEAFFVSTVGTRLSYGNVSVTYRRLTQHAGLAPRSPACRPRIHDLRHSFAVNTLLDFYRGDEDVGARLPVLSTWLGHLDPANTYWYLSASPELMALAGQRLHHHSGDHQ